MYWWVGLGVVSSTVPSLSKSQAQVTGPPVDRSVNCTSSGASPTLGLASKFTVPPETVIVVQAGVGSVPALFDTVKAVALEFCPALDLSIPVGKDSLSMRTVWQEGKTDKAVTAQRLLQKFPVKIELEA